MRARYQGSRSAGATSRPAYYDRPRPQPSAEAYAHWRRSIPYTDAQILRALEAGAAEAPNAFVAYRWRHLAKHLAHTGRLAGVALRMALPYLVTTCTVCGKTALYRYGTEGRCQAHRDDRPEFFVARALRCEQAGREASAWRAARDTRLLARPREKSTQRKRRG